jgi:hypothetical protein
MSLSHQNLTTIIPTNKMSYPSSKSHVPTFVMEHLRYTKFLTPNQKNMQAVRKIWLKTESNIAYYSMMPITRNSSIKAKNPQIQNYVYIFISLPRQKLPC